MQDMVYTTVLALAAGTALASSSPHLGSMLLPRDPSSSNIIPNPLPPTRLTLKAHADGQPLDDAVINANGQNFFIGKYAATFCPQGIPNLICPPGVQTVVQVGTTGAGLYSDVPAGQVIYVHNETGALSFTPAHASGLPVYNHDSVSTFSFKNGTEFDFEGLADKGWLACPPANTNNGTYQIFADVQSVQDKGTEKDCVPIQILATPYGGSAPAWQYV